LALLAATQAVLTYEFKYHTYDELTTALKSYVAAFPQNAYLYSIGKSVQGRDIWVLALASSNPDKHVTLRPEVKYIGGLHGNEGPTKETLITFIDYFLNSQISDPDVAYLMSRTRIHVLPLANPDGAEVALIGDCSSKVGRNNSNRLDLNRNFPDLFQEVQDVMQPETQAIIDWFDSINFILAANFHTGALVINYQYDNYKNPTVAKYSATADDDVIRKLAMTYSYNHPTMHTPKSTDKCEMFPDGIVNGGFNKLDTNLKSILKYSASKINFFDVNSHQLIPIHIFVDEK
jgi:hypothetical protein